MILVNGRTHEKDLRKEHVDDREMIMGAGENGARIGKGEARQAVEVLGEVLLCHDEAVRAPRVAPAHQVAEEEQEKQQKEKEIVRRDRDLAVRAPEAAEDEIERWAP